MREELEEECQNRKEENEASRLSKITNLAKHEEENLRYNKQIGFQESHSGITEIRKPRLLSIRKKLKTIDETATSSIDSNKKHSGLSFMDSITKTLIKNPENRGNQNLRVNKHTKSNQIQSFTTSPIIEKNISNESKLDSNCKIKDKLLDLITGILGKCKGQKTVNGK